MGVDFSQFLMYDFQFIVIQRSATYFNASHSKEKETSTV